MKLLVANLGSTSFKYRLFDMDHESQLAQGGVERIGADQSDCFLLVNGKKTEMTHTVPNHATAVKLCLEQLTEGDQPILQDASEVKAIGFKAVHGGKISGVVRVTEEVLQEMDRVSPVAPAHNPPYIAAMRQLSENLPEIPLIAAFETGYHATIPLKNRLYAAPREWDTKFGIRKWGFHGASHRYLNQRAQELLNRNDLKVITCHLGGSSSVCASFQGESIATSMGMSPQTGLFHNNRCGDFDPFALPVLMKGTGCSLDEILNQLATKSGLLGLSQVSGDVRDLEQAAAEGNDEAQLALDAFITSVRHFIGAYLVELGGADALIFSGGIGEKGTNIRSSICNDLNFLGIELDSVLNSNVSGEMQISTSTSKTAIWVIPTNEELVVARQAKNLLEE
ncbi:Acetate kinase [Planctomycetales bacterium 10988]|nr:Acetate kinase [Planctomycetales bacterium 10988]